MQQTVLAVFSNREAAEAASNDLQDRGVDRNHICLLTPDVCPIQGTCPVVLSIDVWQPGWTEMAVAQEIIANVLSQHHPTKVQVMRSVSGVPTPTSMQPLSRVPAFERSWEPA